MVVLRTGCVEAVCALVGGNRKHLFFGDVENVGFRIDEPADQPGARDSIGLWSGTVNFIKII